MADFGLDSNAGEVAQAFAQAARELSSLEDPNAEAGAIIAAAPQPVVTSQLAASVRADVTANGVTVAGHVRHWSFVEWGAPRRNVRAQHPLGAQVRAREDDIIAVYADHAARVVAMIGD